MISTLSRNKNAAIVSQQKQLCGRIEDFAVSFYVKLSVEAKCKRVAFLIVCKWTTALAGIMLHSWNIMVSGNMEPKIKDESIVKNWREEGGSRKKLEQKKGEGGW